MIRLVSAAVEGEELFQICRGSALGCKLRAIAGAYGFSRSFLRFWTDGSAAYGLLDGQLTISGSPGDPGEAREFISIIGPGSVIADSGTARSLGLEASVHGAVMAKDLPAGVPESFQAPGLREIHALLTAAGMPVDFEPFYLDMSHRIRHGGAVALGAYAFGELAGCAVVSAVTDREALLSAVAVREDCRRRGIGVGLMRDVERALPGRRLYLLRESGRNRGFYERLGYSEHGRWTQQNF